MKKIDAFPIWGFECEDCGAITELLDGDFSYKLDPSIEQCQSMCEECGSAYIVQKPR